MARQGRGEFEDPSEKETPDRGLPDQGTSPRGSSPPASAAEVRPWGYFVVLSEEQDHKVKRLVVYPGCRLSVQKHQYRGEHWYVVRGETLVMRGEEEIQLTAGQSIDIPVGAWHRIQNSGETNLVLIEVQRGERFDEDDIERLEDDYGRA